jgi:hypothetical protein
MPVGGTIAWASLNWGVTAPAAVAALSGAAKPSNRAKAPLIATSGTFITRSMLCSPIKAARRSPTSLRCANAHSPPLVMRRLPPIDNDLRGTLRNFGPKVGMVGTALSKFTVPLCRGHHREVHRSETRATLKEIPVFSRKQGDFPEKQGRD